MPPPPPPLLSAKKKELIDRLEEIFERIHREQNISAAEFPPIDPFKKTLDRKDFAKFSPVKDKTVDEVEVVVATEISRLIVVFTLFYTFTRLHSFTRSL